MACCDVAVQGRVISVRKGGEPVPDGMRLLVPPTSWKHQVEAGWVLAFPPIKLPPCPSSRSPLGS